MSTRRWLSALALGLLSSTAWAHHGWSSYDADKTLKIETALVEVQYRNPHAQVRIDHEGRTWDVILAPTRRMESRGLADGALTKGKTVIVEGYPRRDGAAEIRAERITVDGKTIELR